MSTIVYIIKRSTPVRSLTIHVMKKRSLTHKLGLKDLSFTLEIFLRCNICPKASLILKYQGFFQIEYYTGHIIERSPR